MSGVQKHNTLPTIKRILFLGITIFFGRPLLQDTICKNEDICIFSQQIKAEINGFIHDQLNLISHIPQKINRISDFFSPAFMFLSFGMDYKPNDKFSLMISPLTGKVTIVTDELLRANYGVDADKNMRPEFGAYLKSALNAEIMKNVGLITELGLFTNYLKNPEKVDVDWKIGINMKVNKYISAQLSTQMLYDFDTKDPVDNKAKVQFKELFGVGFSFKF